MGQPVVVEDEIHARELVQLMLVYFPEGAIHGELKKASGMTEGTFNRAFRWARGSEWLVGGGGRKLRYYLNPDGI
jgi:hypothetical protein